MIRSSRRGHALIPVGPNTLSTLVLRPFFSLAHGFSRVFESDGSLSRFSGFLGTMSEIVKTVFPHRTRDTRLKPGANESFAGSE